MGCLAHSGTVGSVSSAIPPVPVVVGLSTHRVVPSPLDCNICPLVPFNIFPPLSLGSSTFLSTNDLRVTPCAADNTLLLSSVVKLSIISEVFILSLFNSPTIPAGAALVLSDKDSSNSTDVIASIRAFSFTPCAAESGLFDTFVVRLSTISDTLTFPVVIASINDLFDLMYATTSDIWSSVVSSLSASALSLLASP